MLFEFVAEGAPVFVLGGGDNRYQFVHADDLADACLRAGGPAGPDDLQHRRHRVRHDARDARRRSSTTPAPGRGCGRCRPAPARLAMRALAGAGLAPVRAVPLAALRRVAVVRHHQGAAPSSAGSRTHSNAVDGDRVLRVVPRPPRTSWPTRRRLAPPVAGPARAAAGSSSACREAGARTPPYTAPGAARPLRPVPRPPRAPTPTCRAAEEADGRRALDRRRPPRPTAARTEGRRPAPCCRSWRCYRAAGRARSAVALAALRQPRWYPVARPGQDRAAGARRRRRHTPLIGLPGRIGTLGRPGQPPRAAQLLGAGARLPAVRRHRRGPSRSAAVVAPRRGHRRRAVDRPPAGRASAWCSAWPRVLAVLVRAYGPARSPSRGTPTCRCCGGCVFLLAVWSVLCGDLAMLPVAVVRRVVLRPDPRPLPGPDRAASAALLTVAVVVAGPGPRGGPDPGPALASPAGWLVGPRGGRRRSGSRP